MKRIGYTTIGIFGLFVALWWMRPRIQEQEVAAVPAQPSPSPLPSPLNEEKFPTAFPDPSEKLIFQKLNGEIDTWIEDQREEFESFLAFLEARFARPTRETIQIYFLRKDKIASSSGNSPRNSPQWSEAFFDGKVNVPIEDIAKDKFRQLVKHEMVHAYLGDGWPPWLEEGLAQYLPCVDKPCDEFRFQAMPGRFSEPSFLKSDFSGLSSNQAKRAYQHSLYLVRYLSNLYGDKFWEDLKLRAQGSPSREIYLMCACSEEELFRKAAAQWDLRKVY